MNNQISARERQHLANVKALACSVCDAPPPSEAHHLKQGYQYICIPLCASCHRSNFNGIHGQARIWSVMKKDEMTSEIC